MQEEYQFYCESEDLQNHEGQTDEIDKTYEYISYEKKSRIYSTQISLNEENLEKIPSNIIQRTRVSNFIMPNMIREVKKILANAFPSEMRCVYKLLEKMFQKFDIKFQVWAFDAILICLIFIRDKTKLLKPKKYFATIEAIRSNLKKYKQRSLSKANFSQDQLQLIQDQYNLCINHLEFYDDQNQTLEKLFQADDEFRQIFFDRMLTTRKNLKEKFMKMVHDIEVALQRENFIDELMALYEKKVEKF